MSTKTHREVMSGASFKPASSERAAKVAAQVHGGAGHRVKIAQRGKRWGCWVWPKKHTAVNPTPAELGRMRVLRIRLERERNSPKPNAKKIEAMMAEYRELEKKPNPKRNPEAAALVMREKFTGLPADKTVVVSRSEHVHEHLAALGDLIELRGKTIKGQPFVIDFKRSTNPRRKSKDIVSKAGKKTKGWIDRRAKALTKIGKSFADTWINGKRRNPNGPTILASNEAGTHLFIEGGDQSLNLANVGLADQAKKEVCIVGPVHYITYHSRKKFEGKEEEHDYEHEFSEESGGPRPSLRYDVKNKAMFLDGGVYYVPKPFFETSPGITD